MGRLARTSGWSRCGEPSGGDARVEQEPDLMPRPPRSFDRPFPLCCNHFLMTPWSGPAEGPDGRPSWPTVAVDGHLTPAGGNRPVAEETIFGNSYEFPSVLTRFVAIVLGCDSSRDIPSLPVSCARSRHRSPCGAAPWHPPPGRSIQGARRRSERPPARRRSTTAADVTCGSATAAAATDPPVYPWCVSFVGRSRPSSAPPSPSSCTPPARCCWTPRGRRWWHSCRSGRGAAGTKRS